MLQFHAHRFMTALSLFDSLSRMAVKDGKPAAAALSDEGVHIAIRFCDDLIEQLGSMGLKLSCKSLQRIKELILRNRWIDNVVTGEIEVARRRMHDELEDVYLFSIETSRAPLWDQKAPLFGTEVEAKFPSVAEDISEAAKCLAVGRYTAVVFHLMRATEALLQQFGTLLGVALANEKNWQNILEEAGKAIKALPQKDAKTIALAGVNAHLYSVKLAWRNEVMHPKATYTEEEAVNVYNNVKTFARELATIV